MESVWFERHLTALEFGSVSCALRKADCSCIIPHARSFSCVFFLIGFYRGFTREGTGYCNSRKWFEKVDTVTAAASAVCVTPADYNTDRGVDKSLARPGRKQATATEDFEFHISYLYS